MKKNSEFHDYVLYDLLGDDPRITSRKMFGGHGLYQDSAIFALIIENTLYFKVDNTNRAKFASRGSKPFCYNNGTKMITVNYWEVPEEILEHRDMLLDWVEVSAHISRTAKKK